MLENRAPYHSSQAGKPGGSRIPPEHVLLTAKKLSEWFQGTTCGEHETCRVFKWLGMLSRHYVYEGRARPRCAECQVTWGECVHGATWGEHETSLRQWRMLHHKGALPLFPHRTASPVRSNGLNWGL